MILPVDLRDPQAVQLYVAHTRLQVGTPVAILVNIATHLVCIMLIHPSARDISHTHTTPMTPGSSLIAISWTIAYSLMVALCLLLIASHKDETKKTFVHGVGVRFIILHWMLAGWIVAWTIQWFILALVLLSISIVLLFWIAVTLQAYPPVRTRPLDTLTIHVPILFLFMTLFVNALPLSIYIVLGWSYPNYAENIEYAYHAWEAMGILAGPTVAGLIWVIARVDIVSAAAGMWGMMCIIWSGHPKPAPVLVFAIVFAILYPMVFAVTLMVSRMRERQKLNREGGIALPPDEEEPIVPANVHNANGVESSSHRVWGEA